LLLFGENSMILASVVFSQYTGLELLPEISPALVIVVPGTAVAKDIPAGDTIYLRLCETVSELRLRQKLLSTSAKVRVGELDFLLSI